MIQIDERVKELMDLGAILREVYFKDLGSDFELPEKLNDTHVKTLMILYFKDDCPMSMISKKTNLEKGSFTPVANKLIKLGYIEKKRDELDKRVYKLHLTGKGKDVAEKFARANIEHMEILLSGLSEKEKKEYFDAIRFISKTTKKLIAKEK